SDANSTCRGDIAINRLASTTQIDTHRQVPCAKSKVSKPNSCKGLLVPERENQTLPTLNTHFIYSWLSRAFHEYGTTTSYITHRIP
ncbi:hypothetical protein, partial [Pseudomonas capeferrum]|uniref:hypothetical protein n=1 Tax=Pseudomonas capeferrum TaxID=1495066 RepID=UPI0030DDA6E5